MSLDIRAKLTRPGGFSLDVALDIAEDRVTALYGPSGSGKTTILRLIAGLEEAPDVEVRFNDIVWQSSGTFVPPHRRQVGYVFQQLNLFPHLNVADNLAFAEKRKHRAGGLSRKEILDTLDLGNLLGHPPWRLSGGEQQRVAIARVLLSNPRLLVMDEPLGSIDADAKNRILPYLQRLHTRLQIPVIYVSHFLDEVLYLADWVVVVANGNILRSVSSLAFSTEGSAAVQPNAAAIIRCRVTAAANTYGLTEVRFEEEKLLIAADRYAVGDSIHIRVPARDVSLARERPTGSSIINVIETTIRDIMDPGEGPTAVLRLGCGKQFLLARITRKSLDDLQLKPGETIFAQIKGVALITDYER